MIKLKNDKKFNNYEKKQGEKPSRPHYDRDRAKPEHIDVPEEAGIVSGRNAVSELLKVNKNIKLANVLIKRY